MKTRRWEPFAVLRTEKQKEEYEKMVAQKQEERQILAKTEKHCVICGKPFFTNSWRKKTCGPECSGELNRRNGRKAYEREKEERAQSKNTSVKQAEEK